MYKVTVSNETKVWATLEWALTDLFSRGALQETWTIEKVEDA